MQPISIEKNSMVAHTAARLVLAAMRREKVLDLSDAQAMVWTGLPTDAVRAAFVFLASDSDARLYTSQAKLMLSFVELPWLSPYLLPSGVLLVWVKMRGVMHALWPLLALAFTAAALSGLAAIYLAVANQVFPEGAKGAMILVGVGLGIIFLFVMPAIILLFALALPMLGLGAILKGEWVYGLAMLPLTVLVWSGLPVLWSISKGLTERAWIRARALFNFGQDTGDALQDERLFVQLARARGGRVVLADLCVLFGWSMKRSFSQMKRLLVEHGGEILVDDYGRIWFDFPTLSDGVPLAPAPIWKREREPRLVFDERSRRLDIAMAVLVVAGVVPYFYLMLEKYEGTRRAMEYVWLNWGLEARAAAMLGLFTVVFVVVLIAARRFLVAWRQSKWIQRLHWFELLRAATRGQVRVHHHDLDEKSVARLNGEVSATEGDNLVLEFLDFRQMEFVEDVWARANGRVGVR